MKYLAIKVEGIQHWIWFKKGHAKVENGKFTGKNGRGKGGAATDIKIDECRIIGRIESDALQYS